MSVPDALVAGRYRIVRLVGTGGMGTVWEAWDERLHRAVALKQLHSQPGLSGAEEHLANERAMREARITARLHHPHAVPVFDVVEYEGHPCLVMQFLPSRPLSDLLGERGVLPPREAARIGAQVGSALAAAHVAGIVHRDVKPGNVLIDEDGTARISDFGISRALGDVTLTSTGLVTGTPAYLSPEVARGGEGSFASDVFSLGATLYTATEGGPPFGRSDNSILLLHKVAAGRFDAPRRSGPLTPLLLRMLSTEPTSRPAMSEAADALARVAALDEDAGGREPLDATAPLGAGPDGIPPTLTEVVTVAARPALGSVAMTAEVPLHGGQAPTEELTGPEPVAARRQDTTMQQVHPPVGPPTVPLREQPRPPASVRRRRAWWVLAALVVLALAAALSLPSLLGREVTGRNPSASGTAPVTSTTATPSTSSAPSTTPTTPSATQSTVPTASATTTTARPVTSAPTAVVPGEGSPTAAQLARAVTSYYALMPRNTEAGYARLSESYRDDHAGGLSSYQRFWGGIQSVAVSSATGSPPRTARATITYDFKDGRTVTERTEFGLVSEDGILKIDSTDVLSSTTR